jgi:heterodisulfide reductase subunit B
MKADAVVVACPLCQMNLDLRQPQAAKAAKANFAMPILYFTQAMGLAFGLSPDILGFDKLRVRADALLDKLEHVPQAPAEGGKSCE